MNHICRNRVLIKAMQPGAAEREGGGGFYKMHVTLNARASFSDFHEFLHSLDRIPGRRVLLESLAVTAAREPGYCEIDMRIVLLAFEEAQGAAPFGGGEANRGS